VCGNATTHVLALVVNAIVDVKGTAVRVARQSLHGRRLACGTFDASILQLLKAAVGQNAKCPDPTCDVCFCPTT